MSRQPFRSSLVAALGLALTAGLAACDKVPLLAPTGTVINLTVTSDVAALNSSVDVIAVLIENGTTSTGTSTTATTSSTTGAGTPVQNGTVVTFTTTIGTIEPAEARTSNGKVTVRLITNGQSGKATITAFSGGARSTAQVTIGSAAVGSVAASAAPQNLPSNGGTSKISALVLDTSGNPLAGVPVSFSTTKGTLAAATVNSDSTGVATTTLTTNAAADVKATVGAQSSTVSLTVSASATLSITPPTSSVATSTAANISINAGTTVQLTNVSVSYGDGQSRSLGTVSGTQSLSHLYASPGIYDVTVSGKDPDGVTVQATAQVSIIQLTATVTATAGTAGSKTATVTVTYASGTTPTISGYKFDFSDPSDTTQLSTSNPSAQHAYTVAGTYTIYVRIIPAVGDSWVVPVTVTVS